MTARADQPSAPHARPGRATDWLALLIGGLLAGRLLVGEAFREVTLAFVPQSPFGPSPAATAWLDTALLTVTVLAWVATGLGRWSHGGVLRPRWGAVRAGAVLLLAATVLSTAFAADKRLAANAGANLLITVWAGITLARLLDRGPLRRLLLAALVAGCVANGLKCISQRAYEFDDVAREWQHQKTELVASGLDPNAPQIVNYERRLRSRNAYGYLTHPNVAAAVIMLGLLVVAGATAGLIGKLRDPTAASAGPAVLGAAVAVPAAVGLYLTGSLGAMLAAGGGLVLLLIAVRASDWIRRRPRAAWAAVVGAYLALAGALAGYGTLRGTLPGTSLAFRWQYWQAAVRAVAEQPATGLGRGNFRWAYMLYKPPASTEEVENPHDIWLTLLVELGPLGLLAGLLLAGGTLAALLRRAAAPEPLRRPPVSGKRPWLLLAAVTWLTASLLSGVPWAAPPDLLAPITLLWLVQDVAVWLAAFAATWWVLAALARRGRAHLWLWAAILAGLVATLVHNLIGISLVTPAGLAALTLLAAAGAADDGDQQDRAAVARSGSAARLSAAIVAMMAGLVLLIAQIGLVALPTWRGQRVRQAFVARLASRPADPAALLGQARGWAEVDRWDPELPRLMAGAALELAARDAAADELLQRASELAEEARRRDPRSFATLRLLAELADLQAARRATPAAIETAAKAWEAALRLYPTNPRTHIAAARAWQRLWQQTAQRPAAQRAVWHLREALAIDATRPPEAAARLRRAERREIEQMLTQLGAAP